MVRSGQRPPGTSDRPAPVENNCCEKQPLRLETPPLLSRISYASHIFLIRSLTLSLIWVNDVREYFYPREDGPNIVKAYECRPHLPVRIFFPKSYDQTSPQTLATLLTIHGGGFCVGRSRDDDEWNRAFADTQNALVIALNYSKAPWAPFPTGLHDLEALSLAVLADESLPIDRTNQSERYGLSRTAVLGFAAGGNLALALSQLVDVRAHPQAPAAALSVCGHLDLSVPPHQKPANRPFKQKLSLPRGNTCGPFLDVTSTFDWCYVPYGYDLRDPLISPLYAPRDALPPFVGLVAAELDVSLHDSCRLACRLARESAPGKDRPPLKRTSEDAEWRVCGLWEVTSWKRALERPGPGTEANERFALEESWDGGGVKWLLVPDVSPGFDNAQTRRAMDDEDAVKDAEMKTAASMREVGRWLGECVWEV